MGHWHQAVVRLGQIPTRTNLLAGQAVARHINNQVSQIPDHCLIELYYSSAYWQMNRTL